MNVTFFQQTDKPAVKGGVCIAQYTRKDTWQYGATIVARTEEIMKTM